MKIALVKIREAENTVVADPELDGCALRDSGVRLPIAERVCPFGNDPTARDVANCEVRMEFCELLRAPLVLNRIALNSDK